MSRKRRTSLPAPGPGAFNDSADFIAELPPIPGATFPSLPPPGGAPGSRLASLQRLDDPAASYWSRWDYSQRVPGVWGRGLAPMQARAERASFPSLTPLRGRFPARRRQPFARAQSLISSLQANVTRQVTAVRFRGTAKNDALALPPLKRHSLCTRRLVRKQVLFALQKSGKGKHHGSGKSYRRTPNSHWSCM